MTVSDENLTPAPDLPRLWDGPDTLAVLVARGALMELGRPDLAEATVTNRAGMPSARHLPADHEIVARAFLLGHKAEGHAARLTIGLDGPAIRCDECWERMTALACTNTREGDAS